MIVSNLVEHEGFIVWTTDVQLPGFRDVKSIFIRQSYRDIYELIQENYHEIKFRHHLVTGVPGIGKSQFYLYFLWRYMNENPGSPILCELSHGLIQLLHPIKSEYISIEKCYSLN